MQINCSVIFDSLKYLYTYHACTLFFIGIRFAVNKDAIPFKSIGASLVSLRTELEPRYVSYSVH